MRESKVLRVLLTRSTNVRFDGVHLRTWRDRIEMLKSAKSIQADWLRI